MSPSREVASVPPKKSKRMNGPRRFNLFRVVMVIALLVLLAGGGNELAAWYGYSRTLAALHDWQTGDGGEGADHKNTLEALVRGWPIRTEMESMGGKQVSLQWWSPWRTYQLQVDTIAQGEVVAFTEIGDDEGAAVADRAYVLKAEALHFPLERWYHKPAEGLFALAVAEDANAAVHSWSGHLPREIVRQALLLSARAELGLITRDGRLDELGKAGVGRERPRLAVASAVLGEKLVVAVYDHRQEPPTELERFTIEIADSQNTLEDVATRMEAFSRGEFRKVLTDSGYSGSPAGYAETGSVPEAVCEDLLKFNFLSQFKALRALHAEAARRESPELLQALAQGYAHLGALVEYHWNVAHKAFKARAMLYAERLLHKTEGAAIGLWTRAYVRTFVGLHRTADADLRLAESRFPEAQRPAWVRLIDRTCQFDSRGIDEAAAGDESLRGLAAYLKLQIASSSVTSEIRVNASTDLLSAEPGCLYAVAMLGEGDQLGEKGFSAREGAPRLGVLLRTTLPDWEELPEESREIAADLAGNGSPPDMPNVAKLIQSLREHPGVSGELPWIGLASLIEETCFALAFQDVYFHATMLGAPTEESQEYWSPVVQSNRFAPLLHSLHLDPGRAKKEALKAIETLDKMLIEVSACPIGDFFHQIGAPGSTVYAQIDKNSDNIYRDLVYKLRSYARAADAISAQKLLAVSPNCPAGVASAIMFDWGATESKLGEWEERFTNSPQVCAALGRRYLDTGRFSDAERVLKRKIELLPDQEGYTLLAIAYQYTKNEEAWVETKLASLEVPAFGLEHAGTCGDLANYYMRRKEFDQAKPYAVRAAGSFSATGLRIAAECCELLGEFEEAEQYHRWRAQRYHSSALEWFKFCCRTGRGDRDAAWEFARPSAEEWVEHTETNYVRHAAICLLMGDQPEVALRGFERLSEEKGAHFTIVLSALIAEELGRSDKRDEIFRQLVEYSTREQNAYLCPPALAAWKLFRDPDWQFLDEGTLEWIIRNPIQAGTHTDQLYIVGKILLQCGRIEQAVPYLQRAASSPATTAFGSMLAGDALQDLGIEPQRVRETELDPELTLPLAHMVHAFKLLDERRYDQAVEAFTKVVELAPELAEGYWWRGQSYQEMDRFDEALSEKKKALEIVSGHPKLHRRFGKLLEIMGRHDEAVAAYRSALEIDPQNGLALLSLAYLRAACMDPSFRDPQAALRIAQQAAESGDLPAFESAAVLAVAHAAAGDYGAANRYVTESLAAAPAQHKSEITQRAALYKQQKPYVREGKWWK